MAINLVNVQVFGHSQQDVLKAVRTEFGRFFSGIEHTRRKHMGYSKEDHAEMLEYQAAMKAWVQGIGERAYVEPETTTLLGPLIGEWVGVYDATMEGQNLKLLDAAARRLSKNLQTTVLTLAVRESRSFAYVLGANGVSFDRLMVGPDFPRWAHGSVHGEAIARSVGRPELAGALGEALDAPEGEAPDPMEGIPLAGYERLMRLTEVLGIHNAALSYRGLALVGPERAERWADFKPVRFADYAGTSA